MATKDSKERAKPGSKKEGEYYHVELRPKTQFKKFRTHDISDSSHERIAGKTESGSWLTQKWLIDKDKAYIDEGGYLRGKDEGDKKDIRATW